MHRRDWMLFAGAAAGAALAFLVPLPSPAQQSSGTAPAAQPVQANAFAKWEPAIAEFEAYDRKNSAPRGAVLFVGSSSMVMWATARDYPEYPVINRGFGGSEIVDSTHFAERIIKPYDAKVIVFYAGDNDIAAGKSAEQVADDFKSFVATVRQFAPKTPVVYLSIKGSKARWALWPAGRAANDRIAAICKSDPMLRFVDVAAALLDKDSHEPHDEFFMSDKLHINAKGYEAWNALLRPVLAELMKH